MAKKGFRADVCVCRRQHFPATLLYTYFRPLTCAMCYSHWECGVVLSANADAYIAGIHVMHQLWAWDTASSIVAGPCNAKGADEMMGSGLSGGCVRLLTDTDTSHNPLSFTIHAIKFYDCCLPMGLRGANVITGQRWLSIPCVPSSCSAVR